MTELLSTWEIHLGGSRQGANVTIRNTQDTSQDISGTVRGWMVWKDGCLEYCSRGKAEYCLIRSNDAGEMVIVPLPKRVEVSNE